MVFIQCTGEGPSAVEGLDLPIKTEKSMRTEGQGLDG